MRRRPVVTILLIVLAMTVTLPVRAQRRPLTQDQVQGLVRDGLGDESGAKLIEQRGIDFSPAEDFLQSLKAAGASEAFLKALHVCPCVNQPLSVHRTPNSVRRSTSLAGA